MSYIRTKVASADEKYLLKTDGKIHRCYLKIILRSQSNVGSVIKFNERCSCGRMNSVLQWWEGVGARAKPRLRKWSYSQRGILEGVSGDGADELMPIEAVKPIELPKANEAQQNEA